MPLTTHTVTLETEFPGGAPLDGTWTLTVVADPAILMDTEGHVVFGGPAKRSTTNGRLVLTLPATGQASLDPPEGLYQIRFESTDKSTKFGPWVFDLTEDKTLDDIAEATGIPVTPSLLSQTIEARDEAVAAAESVGGLDARVTALEDADEAVVAVASVNGETGAVVLDAADVGAAPSTTSMTPESASRPFTAADHNRMLKTTSASAITLTVPAGLPVGTRTEVWQSAAGQVTIATSGGVTPRSRGNAYKTAGQHAIIGIYMAASAEVVIYGDLTT